MKNKVFLKTYGWRLGSLSGNDDKDSCGVENLELVRILIGLKENFYKSNRVFLSKFKHT